jgi:hypothetical protein
VELFVGLIGWGKNGYLGGEKRKGENGVNGEIEKWM